MFSFLRSISLISFSIFFSVLWHCCLDDTSGLCHLSPQVFYQSSGAKAEGDRLIQVELENDHWNRQKCYLTTTDITHVSDAVQHCIHSSVQPTLELTVNFLCWKLTVYVAPCGQCLHHIETFYAILHQLYVILWPCSFTETGRQTAPLQHMFPCIAMAARHN